MTPLQVSTMLCKADRRRAALNPPLPPITREQILHGDLSEQLEESDYDLTTMVNSQFYTKYLFISHSTLNFKQKPLSSKSYVTSYFLVTHFTWFIVHHSLHSA